MAVDKLVDSGKLDACCEAEAEAIIAKGGGTAPLAYDFANNKGFADAIAAIPSGGGVHATLYEFTPAALTSAIDIPVACDNNKAFTVVFNSNIDATIAAAQDTTGKLWSFGSRTLNLSTNTEAGNGNCVTTAFEKDSGFRLTVTRTDAYCRVFYGGGVFFAAGCTYRFLYYEWEDFT